MNSRARQALPPFLVFVGCLISSLAYSQHEDQHEDQYEGQHEEQHADQQEVQHEQHHPKIPGHTLGIFLGDTTEERRDGFTVGLEYEYRFSERYGVGLTLEHVAGDFHTDVLVAPVAWHEGPWKFYAGPGVEDGEEGTEALFRMGVEYGFHIGKFEISPQVDMDFVGGDRLLVFGVVFAIGF